MRPRLIGPAVSVASAARVAAWADGLVTINQPVDVLRDLVVGLPRRRRQGPARRSRSTCRGRRPRDEAEAIALDQWRTNVFTEPVNWDTETPEAFDVMAEHVDIEGVRRSVEVSDDLAWHRDRIAELAAVGFDDVYLHFVGQEQARLHRRLRRPRCFPPFRG